MRQACALRVDAASRLEPRAHDNNAPVCSQAAGAASRGGAKLRLELREQRLQPELVGGEGEVGAARSLPALLVDNLRGDGHDDGDIACVPPPALVRKRPHAAKVRQIEREHLASRRWERAADAGKYAPPRRLAAALIA